MADSITGSNLPISLSVLVDYVVDTCSVLVHILFKASCVRRGKAFFVNFVNRFVQCAFLLWYRLLAFACLQAHNQNACTLRNAFKHQKMSLFLIKISIIRFSLYLTRSGIATIVADWPQATMTASALGKLLTSSTDLLVGLHAAVDALHTRIYTEKILAVSCII